VLMHNLLSFSPGRLPPLMFWHVPSITVDGAACPPHTATCVEQLAPTGLGCLPSTMLLCVAGIAGGVALAMLPSHLVRKPVACPLLSIKCRKKCLTSPSMSLSKHNAKAEECTTLCNIRIIEI
jgi:hypothetical protein